MTEQLTAHQQAPVDHEAPAAPHRMTSNIAHLLESDGVKQMSADPYDQGAFIIDRFIGELAAIGPVISAGDTLDTIDILQHADEATTLVTRNKMEWDGPQGVNKMFTQQAGIRGTLDLLSEDARTGQYFGSLAHRVSAKEGQLAFGSLDQVRAYLDAKESASGGTVWAGAIAEEATSQIVEKAPGIARWNAHHLLASDVPGVRDDQREYAQAESLARQSGVDMELVKRSVAEINIRKEQGIHIGQAVVPHFVTTNYGNLLQ